MELSKRCLWHDLLERMRLLSQCSRKRPHLRGSVLFLIVSELLTGVLRKKMRAECLPTRVKKAIFKGLQFSRLEPAAHNRVVLGSSPSGPTRPLKYSLRLRPLGSPAPKEKEKAGRRAVGTLPNIPVQFNGRTPGLYPAQSPDQRAVLVQVQLRGPFSYKKSLSVKLQNIRWLAL